MISLGGPRRRWFTSDTAGGGVGARASKRCTPLLVSVPSGIHRPPALLTGRLTRKVRMAIGTRRSVQVAPLRNALLQNHDHASTTGPRVSASGHKEIHP